MIRCEKVCKNYWMGKVKVEVLKNIDLEIKKGAFEIISGPSGSGKSTLLNLFGLIDTPDTGSVIFHQQDVNSKTEKELTRIRCRKIGFIFQNFYLIPVLTAYENVEYPLQLLDLKNSERKSLIEKYLCKVGLWERRKHMPNQLSGGERQRVAIARALVKDPDIVIADEPTANLDSSTTHQIVELLKNINEEENTTILIASHDPIVIQAGKRNIQLHDGEISQVQERGR